MTSYSRVEIQRRVSQVLVNGITIDEDEITPESLLRQDLGAESLDFLDIVFRLEKTFDLQIERVEFMAEELTSNPAHAVNSFLTAAGVKALRERQPWRNPNVFVAGEEHPNDITVQELCQYIEWKIAQKAETII